MSWGAFFFTSNLAKEKKTPRWRRYNDKLNFIYMDLIDYIMARLDEVEKTHTYEVATDTMRCWIDDFFESKKLQTS